MKVRLKKLGQQVVVITGASSGIGLATARMAAQRGARVVLSSRDDEDLQSAVADIRAKGGQAVCHVADVADIEQMQALAEAAHRDFGGFDTWINNAGVSMYGRIDEVKLNDARRLFETNYWGVVHGTLAALPHLQVHGGALINVGSVLSDTAYPLQGHYSASKHAVKGFTDSLRMEVHEAGAPVSVTLIQPAAINTPYPQHAKNYLEVEPKHMPPVYAPEVVADAILRCAEHPARDVLVGGGAMVLSATERYAPHLGDLFKEATAFSGQRSDQPARDDDTLHAPRPGDASVRGTYSGHVIESSAYTRARLNPGKTLFGIAVVAAGLAVAGRSARQGKGRGD